MKYICKKAPQNGTLLLEALGKPYDTDMMGDGARRPGRRAHKKGDAPRGASLFGLKYELEGESRGVITAQR